jgi:small-conductance mechanosensitive channel
MPTLSFQLSRRVLVFVLTILSALLSMSAVRAWDEGDITEPDLSTPRRAVAAFFDAVEAGDYDTAARLLDLHALPEPARAEHGREAARQLYAVLERVAWVELAKLSDDPKGRLEDGESSEIIATARLGERQVPITLTRTSSLRPEWLFSSSTVARIPKLYEEHGPGVVERNVPEVLRSKRVWGLSAWQWLGLPLTAVLALFAGTVISTVLRYIATRLTARTATTWDDELAKSLYSPMRLFAAAIVFRFLLDLLALSAAATQIFSSLVAIATIATLAWVAVRVVTVLSRWVEEHAKLSAAGAGDQELRARGIATQVRILRRVLNVAIGIIALALMLTQFELVRNVGVSLLASAGLAGVVLGFAAQRTIGSLIAGIQLSATQPIRIGDVVIVEGEWGTIEEITLTYVVVKVWDERRLIVPMTRFLEHPFQNWTKTSAQLHGTIFFQVDWTFPVDAMRQELDRILENHPCWDKRTKGVVVTDAKERTLEVRVLVSAANSDKLWNLRVDVREKLVKWLQELEGGRYLPKFRFEGAAAPAVREAR